MVWRICWIVSFPQNLALIHAVVSEKPELTDRRRTTALKSSRAKNTTSETIYTCAEDYVQVVFLKYQDNARFPSLCLASENAFLSYFYSKMAIINSEGNSLTRKKVYTCSEEDL